MEEKEKSNVFTVKELSERWNLPVGTIYDLIKENKIPTLGAGGGKRILKAAVENMEEEAMFNPRMPKSIREKRLEEEIKEKEERIAELEKKLIKIHCLTTEDVWEERRKGKKK